MQRFGVHFGCEKFKYVQALLPHNPAELETQSKYCALVSLTLSVERRGRSTFSVRLELAMKCVEPLMSIIEARVRQQSPSVENFSTED